MTEDLTLAGNRATVQGQSLLNNGPSVQGQGIIKDLFRGTTKIVGAVGDAAANVIGSLGDATADVVDAAAPDTVNLTPTINNQASVIGLKTNPGQASVQGQSLRGNGPAVEGQGIIKDILRGATRTATKTVKAVGDATANVVEAAAPETVNITPTMNNQVSVIGLKGAANQRGNLEAVNGATVEGQGFFREIFRDNSNVRNNIRNKVQNIRDRFPNVRVPTIVIGLKEETEEAEDEQSEDTTG